MSDGNRLEGSVISVDCKGDEPTPYVAISDLDSVLFITQREWELLKPKIDGFFKACYEAGSTEIN